MGLRGSRIDYMLGGQRAALCQSPRLGAVVLVRAHWAQGPVDCPGFPPPTETTPRSGPRGSRGGSAGGLGRAPSSSWRRCSTEALVSVGRCTCPWIPHCWQGPWLLCVLLIPVAQTAGQAALRRLRAQSPLRGAVSQVPERTGAALPPAPGACTSFLGCADWAVPDGPPSDVPISEAQCCPLTRSAVLCRRTS